MEPTSFALISNLEIPAEALKIPVTFSVKADKDGIATKVSTTLDFSKLTGEQIMDLAIDSATISLQNKLRSTSDKGLKLADVEAKTYTVLAPGTRRTTDPVSAVTKLAEKLGITMEQLAEMAKSLGLPQGTV
jgi:hypothetical protein